jgi:hypothetical protein
MHTALRRLLPLGLLTLGACAAHAPAPAAPTPPPAPPAATDTPEATSRTVTRLEGGAPRPAWFLCDGAFSDRIAVVERDASAHTAWLTWFSKGSGERTRTPDYLLGGPDPGAGQIYYPLSETSGGREVGFVHAINPGMLPESDRAWLPPFKEVRLKGELLACRWVLGMLLLGFDERRSVLVTRDEDGRLTYQSFDFDKPPSPPRSPPEDQGPDFTSEPTQRVTGGTEARTAEGTTFTFPNGEYTYVVRVGATASLEVQHQGRTVQRTQLLAWTLAGPSPGGKHDP